MTMHHSEKLCFVILEHRPDEFFDDLVEGLRWFCPEADVVWYDSGPPDADHRDSRVSRMTCSRPLAYAKVTPFFFDTFEWAAERDYAYVVNVESDMAFINTGFRDFLSDVMRGIDYLGPTLMRRTPVTSKWRPYRSLRRELPELLSLLGIDYTNRSFSPGQVFTRRYITALLDSPLYADVRSFVARNQSPDGSFTLQEVLLPTLPDVLGLVAAGYPPHMDTWNRYRPYHAAAAIQRARDRADVPFVHPVRRDAGHPARQVVRTYLHRQRVEVP